MTKAEQTLACGNSSDAESSLSGLRAAIKTLEISAVQFDTLANQSGQTYDYDETRFGTQRIILVEDDSSVRKATQSILEALGYEVTAYANGTDAFAAIAEDSRPISLLVTDFNMPGLTGYELAQLVRAKRPGIPILIASGSDESSIFADVEPTIRPPFLAKPFNLKSLARKIRQILDVAAS